MEDDVKHEEIGEFIGRLPYFRGELSSIDFAILIIFAYNQHANKENCVSISQTRIGEVIQATPTNVSTRIIQLENKGFIRKISVGVSGKNKTPNKYKLLKYWNE